MTVEPTKRLEKLPAVGQNSVAPDVIVADVPVRATAPVTPVVRSRNMPVDVVEIELLATPTDSEPIAPPTRTMSFVPMTVALF